MEEYSISFQKSNMNWPVKKLGEVANYITKGATPSTYGYSYSTQGTAFLRAEDVDNNTISIPSPNYFIDQETNQFLNRSQTKPNDLLVSIAGTIGRVSVVENSAPQMNMNQAVALVRPNEVDCAHYLFYILQSPFVQKQMRSNQVTGTLTNISLTTLKNLGIPFPENKKVQKKIVERLDAIRKAQEFNDEMISKSKELFESLLKKIFAGKKDWKKEQLGKLVSFQYGKGLPERERVTGKYPVFGSNGQVGTHVEKLVAKPGIIVGRKGSIGKIVWSEKDYWPIDTTYYIKLVKKLKLKLVYYLLLTLDFNKLNKASGVPGLNRNDAYELPVVYPEKIKEQRKIIEKLDSVQEYKKMLLKRKALLQELFDSTLHKSMKGELDG